MKIPKDSNDISANWLTQALRSTGTIKNSRVSSFKVDPLVVDKGITSQLYRLSLKYDNDEQGAPSTLIIKCSSDNPAIRETAKVIGSYVSEVRFYKEFANQIELRTPYCYYCDMKDDEFFILLLEDLSHASAGSNVIGCTYEQAELAVSNIAKFHAQWWDHPKLSEMKWIRPGDETRFKQFQSWGQKRLPDQWDFFTKKLGDRKPEEVFQIGEQLGKCIPNISKHLLFTPPRTLLHNDYQLDNIYFGNTKTDSDITVIDWAMIQLGRGPIDISYLLSSSMPSEQRKKIEMDLLTRYYEILIENGVHDYSFDDCIYDYKLQILIRFRRLIHVIGSGRDYKVVNVFLKYYVPRCFSFMMDHHILDILNELKVD